MKQVTRDIDPSLAQDLLVNVSRACLTYAGAAGPQVIPVDLQWQASRYLISLPADIGPMPVPDQEAVLLVDEGVYYFDLRAIYIRGQVRLAVSPPPELPGMVWYEVVPTKTVAWDYGMMREVPDEHG